MNPNTFPGEKKRTVGCSPVISLVFHPKTKFSQTEWVPMFVEHSIRNTQQSPAPNRPNPDHRLPVTEVRGDSRLFHFRSGFNHVESNVYTSISSSGVGEFEAFPVRSLIKGLWPELTQVTGTTLPHKVAFCPLLRILLAAIYF